MGAPGSDSATSGFDSVGAALPELYSMQEEDEAVATACLTGPEEEEVVWVSSQLMRAHLRQPTRIQSELTAGERVYPADKLPLALQKTLRPT